MAYQSLYRRYRPHRFSDVRDQEQVVRALRNAVRDDRVGHAYLFSGPRGTGKTSTARILAKALNCEHLDGGEPCGICESCLAIDHGTSYDVQELDAASNRGIDEIRELISRASLGSPGRTKVYILDEVHMLTPAASAALLKTLEEPPDHVVFVLATTDPHKVLPTIRSRTQHYEFRLLGAEELAEHVAWVIHDAGLELPGDVVEYVVRQGGGSARDTLSALERVAAAGGIVDEHESLGDLLDAVAVADTGKALVAVADAITAGRDPRVLGEALLARLRDVFLHRMGMPLGHVPPGDLAQVESWAAQLGDRATTRALESVGEALIEMRQAPDPRIPLEVALVKLTRVEGDASMEGLLARIAKLEAAVAGGVVAGSQPTPAAGGQAPAPAPEPTAPSAAAESTAAAEPEASAGSSGRRAPGASAPATASGSAGPASLARAQLAAQRAERAGRTGTSPSSPAASSPAASSPAASSPAASSPPASSPPAPSPGAPAPSSAPMDAPSASAAPAPRAAQAPGLGPSMWTETVLPSLSGLTKAMYQTADLISLEGSIATIRVDNDHHRQNCERKRADVERALGEAVGRAVSIQFDIGEPGTRPGAAPGSGPAAPRPDISDDPDVHLAGADVHALDGPPTAPAGGLAALTEAFPGAELIEES